MAIQERERENCGSITNREIRNWNEPPMPFVTDNFLIRVLVKHRRRHAATQITTINH